MSETSPKKSFSNKVVVCLLIALLISSIFLGLFPVPSVKAEGENWLTGWTYRKSHVINNATGAGTGYPVSKAVLYNSLNDTIYFFHVSPSITKGQSPVMLHGNSGEWDDLNIFNPNIIDNGSMLVMIYGGQNEASTQCAIGVATASYGNITSWTKYANNPVLTMNTSLSWEDTTLGLYLGKIFKFNSTHYIMYYGSSPFQNGGRICIAFSTNLLSWTRYSNNPVLSPSGDEYYDTWASVVKIGSTYYMYYQVYAGGPSNPNRISLATSSDGLSWTKVGTILSLGASGTWDDYYIENVDAYVVQDGVILAYSGYSGSTWGCGVAYSSSPTGAFTKSSENPILTASGVVGQFDRYEVAVPVFWNRNGKFYMWYQGANGTFPTNSFWSLGLTELTSNCLVTQHSKTDFSDVRFTRSDGTTLLDYWLESKVDSGYATFWVEMVDNLDSTNQTIYVYYGKADATTTSNPQNVFPFYDDFDTYRESWTGSYSVNTTYHWIEINGNVYSGAMRSDLPQGKIWIQLDWAFHGTTTMGSFYLINNVSTNLRYGILHVGYTKLSFDIAEDPLISVTWGQTFHTLGLKWGGLTAGSQFTGFVDAQAANATNAKTAIGTNDARSIYFGTTAGNAHVRVVRVQKYVSPAPVNGAWGSEETFSSIAPTFSSITANTTIAGNPVQLNCTVSDNIAVSGYIFEWNNTGTKVNSTWASGGSASLSGTWNSTIGAKITATVYANDTSNNWNSASATFTLTTKTIVLQLPFDNETGTTTYDWSGYSNDGAISGATRSYDGHYGMSLSFDGTDYVTVVDDGTLDLASTVALSAWVKPSTVSGDQVIFDKPNAYGLYLFDSAIGMMINNNYFNTTTGKVSANTLYHIVGEYTGSAVNIYLGEVLIDTEAYSEAIATSAFDLIIGDAFVGVLDEMQISTAYSIVLLDSIATYPYVYNGYVDTTVCSWVVATLTYNFTGVYICQNSTYPITYAKFNFTDGVNELGLSYTVSGSVFDVIGDEENITKISLTSRSATTSGNALILQARIRIEGTVQSLADVDILLYCETATANDSLLIEDRFSIYGIGGVTTTTIVGDGSLIAGGSVFDIMAQNSTLTGVGSSIRVDTVVPNFQHIHAMMHLYQTAQWDAVNGVWDCPTFDANTGYLEFGVDYMQENCTWITGWKVRIEVLDGAAGTGTWLVNDAAWVRLNVTWYNFGEIIKSDEIYVMYEAYRDENDTTTQFSLFIDLWISSDEFSSNVAGHVSSQYYGMEENGWWLWSTWGPVGSLQTSSIFYDNLYDGDGNITTASSLKMFKVWSKIAKIDPGEGATSCDEHLWASLCEVLQIKYLPYIVDLEGISTPVFMPTTTPNMPLGFFASIGNALSQAIDSLKWALMGALGALTDMGAAALDSIFGAIGVSGFSTSITGLLTGLGTWFANSVTYIGSLIYTFFLLLASIGMFIITWFGNFVNTILLIGTGIADVLSGKSVPLGDFQIGVLGQFWTVIAELIATGALFVILTIYWFNSIDQRAKQTGGGWMSIFMSDIQSMISVFSFIIDLSWRVMNFVIDTTMRFINFFI